MKKKVGINPLGMLSKSRWENVLDSSLLGFNFEVVVVYPHKPESIDFLIFDGGHDVSPSYYGETPHVTTTCNERRDLMELALFEMYVDTATKFIGICRGNQFLNVASKGNLIQDLRTNGWKHPAYHEVQPVELTKLRKAIGLMEFDVNSFHHQAVKVCGENLRPSLIEPQTRIIEGIESIEGDKIRAVQCHPEFGGFDESETILNYLFRRI